MRRFTLKWGLGLLIGVLLSPALLGFVSQAAEPYPIYALGLLPSPPGNYPCLTLAENTTPLPPSVDLSSGMPPVGNQGRQASCVGWAIAYYYRSYQEGVENRRQPSQADEIFSPAFIYNQRPNNTQDAGMSMVSGLRIAVNQGVATLATMPYNEADHTSQPSAAARAEASFYRSLSYLSLFLGSGEANLQMLKRHLATGDPFLLAVPVYSEFFRLNPYEPKIDVPKAGSTFYGGHAVTVVGYDDASRTFKFVNSWGRAWGDRGYAYLTYEFVQQYAWEAWVLVDGDTTPPKLPDRAYELGGAENGVPQSEINSPVFAWEPSNEPTAVFQVYWGPSASGVSNAILREPLFVPGTVTQTATLYLRVRALDAAGNATPWRTLFTFRYLAHDKQQTLDIQSLIPNPPPAP